jgi:aryl-alcohol dehydrogenase-like predicted oxidoreductase
MRLRRDQVDIFHLHNAITEAGGGETLSVQQVLGEVVPAFQRLQQQGKVRFLELTAIGRTTALYRVIDAGAFSSAQVVYNILNPSAATELPPNYPAQGLRTSVPAYEESRRRRHWYPRACRRSAVRID